MIKTIWGLWEHLQDQGQRQPYLYLFVWYGLNQAVTEASNVNHTLSCNEFAFTKHNKVCICQYDMALCLAYCGQSSGRLLQRCRTFT